MASRYIDPTSIALDPTSIIIAVAAVNPRKPGTRGHAFFPRYAVGTTVGELLTAAKRDKVGDAPAHLRWDLSRGAVIVSKFGRVDRTVVDPTAFDDTAITAAILGA